MELRILRHDTVDSTSERAFDALAASTARHGDVHVARAQTRGRGRLGRRWESAPGEGLYMSAVLLPPRAIAAPALTIAAGLAVRDALASIGLASSRLKWPNDLVTPEGRKLAGILVETRGLDPARPHYVVGIGVNVRQRAFPPELEAERPVASLLQLGIDVAVDGVLDALLAALPRRIAQAESDLAVLERDYLAALGLAGARVRVELGERELTGELLGLSIARGLALRTGERDELAPLELVRSLAPAPRLSGAEER